MNATMMLVCLAGSVTAAQQPAPVFQAPGIQVKQHSVTLAVVNGRRVEMPYHQLIYNRINIGMNFLKPPKREDYGDRSLDQSRLATTYFHAEGPLGVVLQKYEWSGSDKRLGKPNTYHADARLPASMIAGTGLDPYGQLVNLWSDAPIAVLGMDVGTVAAYARPGQTLHFTERVPVFVKLSLPDKGEKRYFHYVQDALDRGVNLKIFEGEPRAMMEKNGGENFYQVIVVETYKLPVSGIHKELMTREAMQMLMSKCRDDGILCYHTSNRYYELPTIIASVADDLGYAFLDGHDEDSEYEAGHFTSNWIMVARDKAHLAHLKAPRGYEQAMARKGRPGAKFWSAGIVRGKKHVWTDNGENSFRGAYRADPAIGEFSDWLYGFEEFVISYVGFREQIARVMSPVHNALNQWAAARAEDLNREPAK